MAGEVSGFHLQVSLDIGEFFGIPREELTCFFPERTSRGRINPRTVLRGKS